MSFAPVLPVTATDSPAVETAAQVGFKDWAVICEALGSGRQSLILRKGGIAEGRDGFCFKHERFFLFPTGYHQQFDKVRPGESIRSDAPAATAAETVEIRYLFVLEFAHWLADWSRVARLEPFHVWREEAIRERFEYDEEPGLQCAFGRVYRCEHLWTFPNRPSYGGCRSWVTLPTPPDDLALTAVLGDHDHEQRRREIQPIISAA